MLHWSETFLQRQKTDSHKTIQFKVVNIAKSPEVVHKMLKAGRTDVIYLGIELSKASRWISREAV